MLVRNALENITEIQLVAKPKPVEMTCAGEIAGILPRGIKTRHGFSGNPAPGVLRIALAAHVEPSDQSIPDQAPKGSQWAYLHLKENGSGRFVASQGAILFAHVARLVTECLNQPVADFQAGRYTKTAFRWHRPLFDYVLTQNWRDARIDPEKHIRELAQSGFTHLEINGMAGETPQEAGAPGEFYAPFYAYGIALDQYVDSDLNGGIYPADDLAANLELLRRYADLGRQYGLEPGMLCFEPRTVPERFFDKYPTLRGARVDHPFRSRRPRYTLALSHPLVQDHYRQLLQKILTAVPDLAYLSIWSNDSGAGFEYTSSLYVGRNGGPYLIREWRTHDQIAEAAGRNIVIFLKMLREAASEINPDFRVSLRLEPFKVEHDIILDNLEDRLDIEVPSLLVRGYDLPYSHEKYDDIKGVAGTLHHHEMVPEERLLIEEHNQRGIASHLIYAQGNGFSFEPLVGIPFPWLVYEKLKAMAASRVAYAANLGGFISSDLVPYHVNQAVGRAFMLDPDLNIDSFLADLTRQWVGESAAPSLLDIWRDAEQALRWLPPLPLYSGFGFVWLRLWVRPLVADLHAIPPADRRYYEDFMVGSDNNTNRVDLGRDVLFELITRDYARAFVARIDTNVMVPLNRAITRAADQSDVSNINRQARHVLVDQADRLRGLRCWITTLRSVAVWVDGVYGYLSTESPAERRAHRDDLIHMVDREIHNTRSLLELCQTSETPFMVRARAAETPYMYGPNLAECLSRKIDLMERYRDVEPRIDSDIIWSVAPE